MSRIAFALVFCCAATLSVGAQEPQVGNTIVLVERDIHIPAHPAPGNGDVPFRFASGSTAVVLTIDAATGWLEIRGEEVGGADATGWITRGFIARIGTSPTNPQPQPPLQLPWCPDKGSPNPRPGGRLRIATWNIGNLHAVDGQPTFAGTDPSVKRFAIDYERIRCYIRMFDPDILAVQEIDGEEALSRVVDGDVYNVHVSPRVKPPSMNGRQNTGFAYKKGLTVQERPDVTSLDVANGDLRTGARIDVTHGMHTIALMSVHLKSGCFDNNSSGSSCNTLLAQVPKLEEWIDATAKDPNPFIVLGDFNRRLTIPGDLVWTNLDDGQPANANLLAVTDNMPVSCRDNSFTSFIDHIVTDLRATAFVDRSSFRQVTFRQADQAVWDLISDHCPVVVELWVP
jgi:endonuclease/exonuclease/phosphatase family metal-dependent hydrolase